MDSSNLIFLQYFKLLWNNNNLIIRNVLIVAFLTSLYSIVMPKTFKSDATLMPPKSQSEKSILSNLEGFAFGDFLSTSSDDISNSIMAFNVASYSSRSRHGGSQKTISNLAKEIVAVSGLKALIYESDIHFHFH